MRANFLFRSEVGEYFLKVYAKPEVDIITEHDTLDHVATFPIYTQQVKIV